jgi:hypothetical protein
VFELKRDLPEVGVGCLFTSTISGVILLFAVPGVGQWYWFERTAG